MFDDLNKEKNHLKNEYVLKHFFRSEDATKRTPIELGGSVANPDTIISADGDKGL